MKLTGDIDVTADCHGLGSSYNTHRRGQHLQPPEEQQERRGEKVSVNILSIEKNDLFMM